MKLKIKIEGELHGILETTTGGYLPMVKTDQGEYYLAESSEKAGEAAVDYWYDMANNDPKEFACIIGEERLVQWLTGSYDKFGINSIEDFYSEVESVPEEQFASYDGAELDVSDELSEDELKEVFEYDGDDDDEIEKLYMLYEEELLSEFGFIPRVAYRHN